MAKCPNCGANVGFSKVCPYCGTEIVSSNAPKQTSNIEQIKEVTKNFTEKPTCSEAEFQEMVVKFLANASEKEKNIYGARVNAYSENYRSGGTGIVNNPVKSEYARSGGEASNFESSGTTAAIAASPSNGPKKAKNKKTLVIVMASILGLAVVIGCAVGIPAAVRAANRKSSNNTESIDKKNQQVKQYSDVTLYYCYPNGDPSDCAYISIEYGTYTYLPTEDVPTESATLAFLGYYDSPSGGICYFDTYGNPAKRWDCLGPVSLYGHWQSISVNISLYSFEFSENSWGSVVATPNEQMPTIPNVPTRTGYSFYGFFDEFGTMYYNSLGYSTHICDLENNAKLYAHWMSSISWSYSNPETYGFEVYSNSTRFRSNNSNVNSSTAVMRIYFYSTVTFTYSYKVSSESGYDYFSITLDGYQRFSPISGETGWLEDTITVLNGSCLELTYQKDSGYSSGDDCAYFAFC